MTEPITISLVAGGVAVSGVSVVLTITLTGIKILRFVNNKYKIITKIKNGISKLKESRKQAREQKEAMKVFATIANDPDLKDSFPDLVKKIKEMDSKAATAREVDAHIKSTNMATATANVRVEYPRIQDIGASAPIESSTLSSPSPTAASGVQALTE